MAHKTQPAVFAVVVTGTGLLAAATAGLPWPWAVPVLTGAALCLITGVGRAGRGATALPLFGIVGLTACAVVPGGHLSVLWALLAAVATVAYLTACQARTAGLRHKRVPRAALGAVVVAAATAALTVLSAPTAAWLLPVGLTGCVLAFVLALTGVGGRYRP
ncbi:hypothetical protein ABTX35_00675 [Streptomyces sp. NPDC096080]|uniref:hypothetical protein n=1 Tax=Streptomyces sp. NPDC096080 TaxID=3156693 RepID=UPI00332FA2BD